MFPEKIVYDEVVAPKDFDSLTELVETTYRVDHEQTTLETIARTLQTPEGEWRVTRDFLEQSSSAMRKVVIDLFKAGRREEAEKADSLFRRFRAAASEQEEDVLAEQFSNTYHL
jgi:hypothetical protein